MFLIYTAHVIALVEREYCNLPIPIVILPNVNIAVGMAKCTNAICRVYDTVCTCTCTCTCNRNVC